MSPLLTPTRRHNSSPPIRRRRATACRAAAASNPATALENVAITPSPRLFTTNPPDDVTTSRLARSNSPVRTSATTSPTRARHAVEPTTSVNTTVTVSGATVPIHHSTARHRRPTLGTSTGGDLAKEVGEAVVAPNDVNEAARVGHRHPCQFSAQRWDQGSEGRRNGNSGWDAISPGEVADLRHARDALHGSGSPGGRESCSSTTSLLTSAGRRCRSHRCGRRRAGAALAAGVRCVPRSLDVRGGTCRGVR